MVLVIDNSSILVFDNAKGSMPINSGLNTTVFTVLLVKQDLGNIRSFGGRCIFDCRYMQNENAPISILVTALAPKLILRRALPLKAYDSIVVISGVSTNCVIRPLCEY